MMASDSDRVVFKTMKLDGRCPKELSTEERKEAKVRDVTTSEQDKGGVSQTKTPQDATPLDPSLKARALQHLIDGTWWEQVKAGLDEVIAGEDQNKRLLYYSGLSSALRTKNHVYLMGESQQGKTFLQVQIANNFFSSIVVYASTMSGRAAYAEAQAKEDPHFYANKILLVDEFKDLPETTKATIKLMTTPNQDKLVNKTLDDRRKFQEQVVEGMPVIWTNSMEIFEDEGAQIANRYFKANIDESPTQSNRVEGFQRKNAMYGDLIRGESNVPLARAITELILAEKVEDVLNLFSEAIIQVDNSMRSHRIQFEAMVKAVAYANRHQRPFIMRGDKKYVLATLSDNITALEIWHASEATQEKGLPERYLRVLNLLNEDGKGAGLTSDEVSASYGLKHPGRVISSDTVENYLRDICKRNLATSRREANERGEDGKKVRKYYKLPISTTLHNSGLWIISPSYASNLDSSITPLKEHFPQFHKGLTTLPINELSQALIDSEPKQDMISYEVDPKGRGIDDY
jgi:hypothetical protein